MHPIQMYIVSEKFLITGQVKDFLTTKFIIINFMCTSMSHRIAQLKQGKTLVYLIRKSINKEIALKEILPNLEALYCVIYAHLYRIALSLIRLRYHPIMTCTFTNKIIMKPRYPKSSATNLFHCEFLNY